MRFLKQLSRCYSVWYCDQFTKRLYTLYTTAALGLCRNQMSSHRRSCQRRSLWSIHTSPLHIAKISRGIKIIQLVKTWLWKKERRKNWKAQEVFPLQVKFKIRYNSFKSLNEEKKAKTTWRKEGGSLIWSTQPYEEVCCLIWIKVIISHFFAN